MQITINTDTASPALLKALCEELAGIAGNDAAPAQQQAAEIDPATGTSDPAAAAQQQAADPGAQQQEQQQAPPPADKTLHKDSTGAMIPWDARIHSKNKSVNGDGTWRYLKGVDKVALVPQVEAELRAATPAPAAEQTASDPAAEAFGNQQQQQAAAPAPAAATGAAPMTFKELLPKITAGKNDGTITEEAITNCCNALGITQIGELFQHEDKVPEAAAMLGVS